MKIELHLLQNFAPSNLNRDDTGSPKHCEFGGHRRARISSQCIKRAIRQAFADHLLFGDETEQRLAVRTRRLVDEVAKRLLARGRNEDDARRLTAFALQGAKLRVDNERKTQYLLFIPKRTIDAMAKIIECHWTTIEADAPRRTPSEPDTRQPAETGSRKRSKGADKTPRKEAVPKEISAAVQELLGDIDKAPDLALFGRMIADNPDWNIDAACQVAHAISTHRASVEFDYFTAIDDLREKENTGVEIMGAVEFQSACFYRYACLDLDTLRSNLGGVTPDEASELTFKAVEAFLRASALAIPAAKQNCMAAQNLPSYLLALVRRKGAPQSFANAFVNPVRPTVERGLIDESARRLEEYLDKSLALWGSDGIEVFSCGDVDATLGSPARRRQNFQMWVEDVVHACHG